MVSNLLFICPPMLWLTVALLVALVVDACRRIDTVWARPALLVYVTISAWYLGDFILTGPMDFLTGFGTKPTNLAFSQIALFLVSYRIFVQKIFSSRRDPNARISVLPRLSQPAVQRFFLAALGFWLVLFIIGLSVADWNILAIIWPPSTAGEKVGMFSRNGIGSGGDFLLSTGGYLYTLVCALYGMTFVLGRGFVRWVSLAMIALTWPYFLFDRARSGMLAVLMPGVFCYLIGTWGDWVKKGVLTAVTFGLVSLWFGQVMRYRDTAVGDFQMSAFGDFSKVEGENTQHLGLDMLKELCLIDYFIDTGDYEPNWGQRYFAEAANCVPRSLWANKPLIGYDYAYARGFRDDSGDRDAVYATVSTGMIGQGVANFGRFFGPVAAAFLMGVWTLILAKLWRRRFELPRFLLFLVGCGLTFNMGRDITLLVLWPFVFGYGLVVLYERIQRVAPKAPPARRRLHLRPARAALAHTSL